MLKKKQAGIPASRDPAAPRPQAVVNLMDALRRSIQQESGASVPSIRDRKRSERQAEMLLPISGKRPMKPWQSQPGGQAVGKRPAERALHACGASRQRSARASAIALSGFPAKPPRNQALHRFHRRVDGGIGAEQGENRNLVAAKTSGKTLILLSKTSFFERNSVT